jgi:hypothetical protein
MSAETIDRPVPFTFNRAITELVQAERELDRARGSLRLALDILGSLGADLDGELSDALDRVLDRVLEAEATLAEVLVTERSGTPKLAARSA